MPGFLAHPAAAAAALLGPVVEMGALVRAADNQEISWVHLAAAEAPGEAPGARRAVELEAAVGAAGQLEAPCREHIAGGVKPAELP